MKFIVDDILNLFSYFSRKQDLTCQILSSRGNKKITNLSSAKFTQSVVKVKLNFSLIRKTQLIGCQLIKRVKCKFNLRHRIFSTPLFTYWQKL